MMMVMVMMMMMVMVMMIVTHDLTSIIWPHERSTFEEKKVMRNGHFPRPAETDPYRLEDFFIYKSNETYCNFPVPAPTLFEKACNVWYGPERATAHAAHPT